MKVNCAAIPSDLLESELAEKGAFNGAISTRGNSSWPMAAPSSSGRSGRFTCAACRLVLLVSCRRASFTAGGSSPFAAVWAWSRRDQSEI